MAGGRINFARGYKMGYAQAITDCDCDLDPNVGAIDPNLIRVF
jgi:hypothetical protein